MLQNMGPKHKAYFTFAVAWIVISAWQYGFHISALNSAQDAISCRTDPPQADHALLPSCIPMDDFLFGVLTSLYTIGGLAGSLVASRLADQSGRRRAVILAALSVALGSILMTLASHYALLVIGRFILGIGCGLSTVLVPMYLHEIAPPNIRGSIGVLNQLAIVFGILIGQVLSLPFARPNLWRAIFSIPAGLAVIQIILSPAMIESPMWALQKASREGKPPSANFSGDEAANNGSVSDPDDVERQGLLRDGTEGIEANRKPNDGESQAEALTLLGVLGEWRRDPAVAKGMQIVLITQLAQQLSGINAVMYYSTAILKSVLSTKAAYISLFITFVNVVMTFPPIFLIERLGRRSLLIISSTSMAISSLVLAFSINFSFPVLSSVAIVAFVAAFSVGLGPVPFVVLGDVMPSHAKSAASSFGLGVNWLTNFVVGLLFLPLRNALSSGGGHGDGNVFFVFVAFSVLSTLLIGRAFRS